MTIGDIKTFQELNNKIADCIFNYIEIRHPELIDFWIDSWDAFESTIMVEIGTEDGYFEFDILIDDLINVCNNED